MQFLSCKNKQNCRDIEKNQDLCSYENVLAQCKSGIENFVLTNLQC